MMLHPLVLALTAVDLAAVVLMILAGITNAQILVGWQPHDPDSRQLNLERRSEAASMQAQWSVLLFFLGSLLLVMGVSSVLPKLVPGAMCGTGVVQASNGLIGRALFFRLLALLLLSVWQLVDRLHRSLPCSPIVLLTSRLQLLAVPVAGVAIWSTLTALASLDVHTPVDCCSVLFDQIRSTSQAAITTGLSDAFLVRGTCALTSLLMILTIVFATQTKLCNRAIASLIGLLTPITVLMAAVCLVRVLSAYHYGVLHHHCPWCLFLSEHTWVGYPMFGSLIVILLQSGQITVATFLAHSGNLLHPHVLGTAQTRARVMIAGWIVFVLLGVVPPLIWRLEHGVWMSG